MKRLRSLAVLFLALYLLFAIGIQFHSDNDARQVHRHCNLCQAAHVSFIETPNWYGALQPKIFGIVQLLKRALLIILSITPRAGRDPPNA